MKKYNLASLMAAIPNKSDRRIMKNEILRRWGHTSDGQWYVYLNSIWGDKHNMNTTQEAIVCDVLDITHDQLVNPMPQKLLQAA